MWTSRSGEPISAVAARRPESQRMLTFCSIGTRVGLTWRLSAFVPLKRLRVQNFAAASPSGSPSGVTTRLECISRPHCVSGLALPPPSGPRRQIGARLSSPTWPPGFAHL